MARQGGWGLLAAAGAVLFVSLVIAGQYSREMGAEEKKQVDLTRDVIVSTAEVLYQFRLENANTWPSAMSDLVSYAPVLAANARNGVGQPLTLVPPTPANHPTDPMVIRTDLLGSGLAERVRSEFPGQARAGTGTVVDIEIPVPGQEPPVRVQELLVRDGTRDMSGDLDMAGNAIDDVGNFRINDRLDIGRDLDIGRELVVGQSITVGGQTLTADGARFLRQMAGLNCGPNRLLNISGNQAYCVNFNPTGSLPPPILPPAVPGVSITGGSPITEGGDAIFTLTPTVPFTSAVTIVLRVTDDGGDFIAAGDEGRKTVTFPAGAASVTWTVPTVDDAAAESSARVTVRVDSGTGYVPYVPTSASVDVNDNDGGPPSVKPVITVTGGSAITEGGTAVFTVHADRASTAAISIRLDVSDDAGSGDFLASSSEGRKTVALPAHARTVRYDLRTVDDTADEPDGRVSVRVVASSGYTVGSPASAQVAVNDDDGAGTSVPEITVTARPGAITEGGTAAFTINADRVSPSPISISLDINDDAGPSDFLATSSEGRKTVTLPANARTVRYDLRTVDDTADEPNGRITVRVASSGSGYTVGTPSTAYVAVNDDDTALSPIPAVSITGRPGSITEGGDAIFTVRAGMASTSAISVSLDVSDDAASDFLASSSEGRKTVTLPAGRTAVGYTVRTVDDTDDETDGRVTVRVAGGTGYTVGTPSTAYVAVNDDDTAPPATPRISVTGGSPVEEGNDAIFTIRSDRVPAAAISVQLNVSDDTGASDFLASSREGRKSVSLGAGVTSVRYRLPTEDDRLDEPDGAVSVHVLGSTGYTAGTPSSASVSVTDNDGDCPRPAGLHPDAVWSGPPDCESSCGPIRVRNLLTIITDQTDGRIWYQLSDISSAPDCPVTNLGIGTPSRWRSRCDPRSRTGDYLRSCGPWQSQIYYTNEGACGVEYCLTTPMSFFTDRNGRGYLASSAGSLHCPDPGSNTFAGIDFTTYRCQWIYPGVNNNWRPR